MKALGLAISVCFCLIFSQSNAQEIKLDSLLGDWEYVSPKGKIKLTYTFSADQKFVGITTQDEKEIKSTGSFEVDKKNGLDRLKLNTNLEGSTALSQINYYFIKSLTPDRIKVQMATEKLDIWQTETDINTMIFVRKKAKKKAQD